MSSTTWSNSSRRASNFSDLIQRVTASCLLHPLLASNHSAADDDEYLQQQHHHYKEDHETANSRTSSSTSTTTTAKEEEEEEDEDEDEENEQVETVTSKVFEAVTEMKRAYGSLQAAHSPWDPDKIRAYDAAVVAQLKRLSLLKETFHRRRRSTRTRTSNKGPTCASSSVRELVAPYEAAVEELKMELKAKQVEIDSLKEKLNNIKKKKLSSSRSHHHSKTKVNSCSALLLLPHVATSPAPELFEATMGIVIKASKSFATNLVSLMRSAHWDLAAAVRSIEAATITATTATDYSVVGAHQAKYALESYVSRKIFQGFDHETFYMDGSLSSLLDPNQFRRDSFTQYRDMKSMDPTELLGVLPTCPFGNFCSKKYLAILHPRMEKSLFGGDLEQRRQVLAGNHPRTHFYGQFLALAKAVWLLHLLAFSLDPPPRLFEVTRGTEFQSNYMESVSSSSSGASIGGGQVVVGFPVTPGFKLGNGLVIRARVYVVPTTI